MSDIHGTREELVATIAGQSRDIEQLRAALDYVEKEKEVYRMRWLSCVTPEEAELLRAQNEKLKAAL